MYQCNKTIKTNDFKKTDISTYILVPIVLQQRKLWQFDQDNYTSILYFTKEDPSCGIL